MKGIWYARFPSDYRRDTAHLSMMEHGAYTLLLDHYYSSGRPIPAAPDPDGTCYRICYRICHAFATDERDAVRSVVDQFFVLCEDGWHNQRADAEIAKYAQLVENRRKAGKAGNEKRWGASRNSDPKCDPKCDPKWDRKGYRKTVANHNHSKPIPSQGVTVDGAPAFPTFDGGEGAE